MRLYEIAALFCLIAAGSAQGSAPPDFSRRGLELWLAADGELVRDGAAVVQWNDRSGRGNHAQRHTGKNANPTNPTLVPDAYHAKPVLRFDGTETWYSFRRIANIRTVFLVVQKDPKSFGQHNQRFLLGDSDRGPRYDGDFHVGKHKTAFIWAPDLSSPFVREGETRLNGALEDGLTTNYPTTLGVISLVTTGEVWANQIGRDRDYTDGRAWQGDIAEILVYSVVLRDEERSRIERYLMRKYEIVPARTQPAKSPIRATTDPSPEEAPGPNYVSSVAFSPDGKAIATGSFDHMVRLWDATSGECILTLKGHTERVWHVAFRPDGKVLASSGLDRIIRLWELPSGKLLQSIPVEE